MLPGLDFDDVLKLLGALALIFGPVATWRVGKATAAAAQKAAEAQRVAADAQREALALQERNAVLAAQTARIEIEFEVIQAGQRTWHEMFEASAKRADQQGQQLDTLVTEHRDCLAKVARLERIAARQGWTDG